MSENALKRVVLVTGGTGAIGSTVCRLLGERGDDVAFTYRSNDLKRDEVLASLRSGGSSSVARSLDLADEHAVASFIAEVNAELGPIGALIHAGGPHVPQRFVSQFTSEELVSHLNDEVLGFFTVVRSCLDQLRERRGSITAVTTVATRRFPRRDSLSSAPKASVEALARALASEEGKFGVRANCVGPGILDEGMASDLYSTSDFDEAAQAVALEGIPLGRFGTALEVAQLVCFLSSEEASYITGQMIDVDGGYGV